MTDPIASWRRLLCRAGAMAVVAVLAACASTPAAAPPLSSPAATSPAPAPSPAPPAPPAPASAPIDAVPADPAASEAALQQAFADWIVAFSATARAAGIDDATLHAAFDGVRYAPRVVDSDRTQPEFVRAVWDYLDRAVSPQRVALGRQRLAEVRVEADAAAARYGVPPPIVVAIWGMESNYGSNYGDIPTIDALATLGFEGRREDWARRQLLAALKILQNGDIERGRMVGSWAGAMGQTQFLPSNFLAYAVDADGDGRRDIWGSMADVTASTANFLARSGWRAGQPWGAEVRLPAGFDPARADAQLRQSSAQWAQEGVQGIDGTSLPELDEAMVLLPAGARGPAFLVGPNFRAILRYNNSNSYALAVGLLAQQLGDGPGVVASWPRDLQALTRTQLIDDADGPERARLRQRHARRPDGAGHACRPAWLPAQHRRARGRLPHARPPAASAGTLEARQSNTAAPGENRSTASVMSPSMPSATSRCASAGSLTV